MHLDYRLSEDWDENSTDLAAADETDLRYYAAIGDVILRNDQTDLSARWGWIPLIDFALAMREISEGSGSRRRETRRSSLLSPTRHFDFERRGQEMTVSGSYATGEIVVPFAAFIEQAADFARRLDEEVRAKRPDLNSIRSIRTSNFPD